MPVDWNRRIQNGCDGVCLAGESECIAHARVPYAFISDVAEHLDLRGVPIDRALLAALLNELPREDDRRVLTNARFDHAVFTEGADFNDVVFVGNTSFDYARFDAEAVYSNAIFDTASSTVRRSRARPRLSARISTRSASATRRSEGARTF